MLKETFYATETLGTYRYVLIIVIVFLDVSLLLIDNQMEIVTDVQQYYCYI